MMALKASRNVTVQRENSRDNRIVGPGESLEDKDLQAAGLKPLSDDQKRRLEALGVASRKG